MLTSTEIFGIVSLVAFVALLAIILLARSARRRHAELVDRFGPEYARAVDELGSERSARRELAARERRVQHLALRTPTDRERQRLTAHWNGIQASFFDDPVNAARKADDLIKLVMQACGYEMENFDQRVADLSVEHGNVVQHYRAARALTSANQSGHPDVDELRQAILHYRTLFVDLLAQPEREDARPLRHAHAH